MPDPITHFMQIIEVINVTQPVNDQWRICFRWEGSDAFDVEITDYH
jgi:hypothetical protein